MLCGCDVVSCAHTASAPALSPDLRRELGDAVGDDHMVAGGYGTQQPPYDANWGARYAVVADPDGNGVGIMSPLDPDKRLPWPDPPA